MKGSQKLNLTILLIHIGLLMVSVVEQIPIYIIGHSILLVLHLWVQPKE